MIRLSEVLRGTLPFPFTGIIKYQLILLHFGRRKRNSFKSGCRTFYLSELDPETPELHLVINASQVFQFSLPVVPRQVSRVIDPDFFFTEVRKGKLLLRKFRLIPVPKSHLGAGKAQFPRKSLWQKSAFRIHDIRKTVMNRPSDGYRPVIPRLIEFVIGCIHRKLRGPVCIVNRSPRLWHGCHRLSANAEVIHIERLIRCQQLSELGGIGTAVDRILLQEFPHFLRIPPCALRHDAYRSARGQRRKKILHRSVKRKIRVKGDAALFT